VAYVEPGEEPVVWSRTIPGTITEEERWTRGLPAWIGPGPEAPLGGGYNAIFVPAHETRTLAQTPPEEGLSAGYREPLFYAALVYLVAIRE
jgi:inosine/xanthosine triphosphate pyrophosphatase family protein